MTLTQAAKFLRVSPTALMRAVHDGVVPAHVSGQRLWFSHAEVIQSMQTARRYDDDAVEGR